MAEWGAVSVGGTGANRRWALMLNTGSPFM